MQRMRELAVQSANGTYTDEDREQIQYEVDALKDEVDRIAESTEYNEMKLLDGSLDGGSGNTGVYGARYGFQITADANGWSKGDTITSNVAGVTVSLTKAASGAGGENASWNADGTELSINLVKGKSYSQSEIDDLIKNADTSKLAQTNAPADVKVTLANGRTGTIGDTTGTSTATAAGVRATQSAAVTGFLTAATGTEGYADKISFTSNSYGVDTRKITISIDVGAGKENVTTKTADADDFTKNGEYVLHLSTGVDYSEDDISRILSKSGLDYDVKLEDTNAPDGDVKFRANQTGSAVTLTMAGGAGVGKDAVKSAGEGLTFQIGANGVEDQRLTVNIGDMGSNALGIKGVSVAKQEDANAAINKIDDAIKSVSTQRAKLGAVQNRLEHTVNSLNTANENMTASESQIRDTDMAAEMIKYTKSNILQQASQSMLAQANQQPQGVLQLLG
jgi:flagellin